MNDHAGSRAWSPRSGCYLFTVYVAGHSPNSTRARANLEALCRTHLAGRYEIIVVDVLKDPLRAMAAGVVATPTTLKLHPAPVQHVIGDLSDTRNVLAAFDLRIG